MKLILAIVSNDDSSSVSSALTKANFQVTRLATTGGFLRAGNTTMIVGTDDDKVDQAIEIIGNEASAERKSFRPPLLTILGVTPHSRVGSSGRRGNNLRAGRRKIPETVIQGQKRER